MNVPNPYAVQVRDLEWSTVKRFPSLREACLLAARLRRAGETVRVTYLGVVCREVGGPFAPDAPALERVSGWRQS